MNVDDRRCKLSLQQILFLNYTFIAEVANATGSVAAAVRVST